jgi:2-C-methyl-D-erythritol 4-phosphate cytidylyltransferase
MKAVALVLGAGEGLRLGTGTPKALVRVAGRTLLHWSAEALARSPSVGAVLPVVPAGAEEALAELREKWSGQAMLLPAVGGGSVRQESLKRGLEAMTREAPDAEWVLVHDAARCLVRPEDADQVLERARETGAAIPVVPVGDTVKEVDGDRVVRTLDRSRLAAAQTPQCFRVTLLREALAKADQEGITGTDCASLVEHLGTPVRTCPGRPGNWKVTVAADLERAETLLAAPVEIP